MRHYLSHLFFLQDVQPEEASWGAEGDYVVKADWTVIEVENKVDYYNDAEEISWSIESDSEIEAINDAGGNVVGVLFDLNYPSEDETPNFMFRN